MSGFEIENPFESETVYFFFLDGCAACNRAKPEWKKFIDRNPRVMALGLNAAGPVVANMGVELKATPSYLLKRGQKVEMKTGIMTCAQLEKWVKDKEKEG